VTEENPVRLLIGVWPVHIFGASLRYRASRVDRSGKCYRVFVLCAPPLWFVLFVYCLCPSCLRRLRVHHFLVHAGEQRV